MTSSGNGIGNSQDTIVRRFFDPKQSDPTVEIPRIVAELENTDVKQLTPIYRVIDHLLDHLFETPPPEYAQAQFEFTYEGYRITVAQDGQATFLKVN